MTWQIDLEDLFAKGLFEKFKRDGLSTGEVQRVLALGWVEKCRELDLKANEADWAGTEDWSQRLAENRCKHAQENWREVTNKFVYCHCGEKIRVAPKRRNILRHRRR